MGEREESESESRGGGRRGGRMTATTTATSGLTPFVKKTYEMVCDPSSDQVVSWSRDGNSFVIWNSSLLTKLLPLFFKHNNFSSFVRQLNTYGFRKVDPDRWEFAHEDFQRGQEHLLKNIERRKPVTASARPPQPIIQSNTVKSCVEVGKFGLEGEIERLKRDKDTLMQELVRLRQRQQVADNQLQGVGQRVQGMEQRQQQMMSFLAKAIQSPGFLAQFVQQQNDSSRRVTGVSKKRRLPTHDEDDVDMGSVHGASSDGQIVKYQPLINEAAKSMLLQILNINGPLPDQSPIDPKALMIDHVPAASGVVDSRSCSTRTSGVTLSEVQQNCKQSVPSEAGLSPNCEPLICSKMHAFNSIRNDSSAQVQNPEANSHNLQGDAMSSGFKEMQEILHEDNLKFAESRTEDSHLAFMDSLSLVQNRSTSMDVEKYSPAPEWDVLLPGSNDTFWEQFFPASPFRNVAEEVDSSTPEDGAAKEHETGQDQVWEKLRHMNHLTEQMGLLTAEAERV